MCLSTGEPQKAGKGLQEQMVAKRQGQGLNPNVLRLKRQWDSWSIVKQWALSYSSLIQGLFCHTQTFAALECII